MAYGKAPSPKSVRIIRQVTAATLPAGAMEEMPVESLSPGGLGTQRVQPGDVVANRHHSANIATGSTPTLSGAGDHRLGPLVSGRMIIEGVTDRAAVAGNTYTAATVALTSGQLVNSAGNWSAEASWIAEGMLIWIEGIATGPFLTHGGFWGFVEDITADDITLSSLLPIPSDMAEGANVRIRQTRQYSSLAADDDVVLLHALEIMSASGKGDEWLDTVFSEFGISLTQEGVVKQSFGLAGQGLPIALTSPLANATTAASSTAPAMSAGVDFGAKAEPNSGAALRVNSVTLDDLLLQSLNFRHANPVRVSKGAGAGTENQVIHRDGHVTAGLDLAVERATTQSDDVIALLRASGGSTVPTSFGFLDSAGNRRLCLIPALDLGEEGDSGVKQSDAQVTSVGGTCRASSLISGGYWIIADADAV